MNEISQWLGDFFAGEQLLTFIRAAMLVIGGIIVARLVSVALVRLFQRHLDAQQRMLVAKTSHYLLLALFFISAINELGFNLSVLLGAAGILTVAIGFASQTSASNLISGLFLIAERPFGIGDVIQIGKTQGEVLSIGLLSIQLRTFDNLFIRIPNEAVIKAEITNMSRFPIRRVDLSFSVAYKEDIAVIQQLLLDVADRNPLCLVEPKPLFILRGFDSASQLQFSVWGKSENFLDLKNSIQIEIKAAFEANHIEMPSPQLTVYSGGSAQPFAVIVNAENAQSVEKEK